MSDDISNILKQIEKKLDLRVGPLSGVAEEVRALTTGNIAIDYITGVGGLPLGRSTELIGPPASGKSQDLDALVLTPDRGFIRMGDVKVGDSVVDPNGQFSIITGVFPQGVLPVYRITFNDGSSTTASADHLWSVQEVGPAPVVSRESRRNGACARCAASVVRARGLCINCYSEVGKQGRLNEYSKLQSLGRQKRKNVYRDKILTTDEINTRLFSERPRIRLPLVNEFDFNESLCLLDPYTLGLLLGDGSFRGGTPTFTNALCDKALVTSMAETLPAGVSAKLINASRQGSCPVYSLSGDSRRLNPLTLILKGLGLWGKHSHEKFVPLEYKHASYKSRLALLQGLMDTDGGYHKGSVEFSSSSKQLRDDVVWLARSLGLVVRLGERETLYPYDGQWFAGRTSYRAYIAETQEVRVFRLERKLRELRKNASSRLVVSVEYEKDAECQCISVSASSKLYITDDFIPTHNTSVALQTAAELQKVIIAEDREEFILYSDFEHALDKEYAANLGLDVEHPSFLLMQPDSLEQGVNAALLLLDTDRIRLSIWDSVASMTPDSMSNSEFSSRPMEAAHKAKLMSDFIRVLNAKLHRHSCSAVFLNHIMDVIETGFAPRGIKRTTTPGGKALKYYASVRIEFQQISTVKGKAVNALTNEEADRIEATNVKVKVVKNKIGPPFRECTVRVLLGKGFDNLWSAVQILLAYKKITAGGGGYYYFDAMPELEHESMERSTKGRITLRSERALLEFAKENPDWAKKVITAAKDLLPTSALPTDEELFTIGNSKSEAFEEPAPLDLGDFGSVEDYATPPKLGLADLNSFSISSEAEKTD